MPVENMWKTSGQTVDVPTMNFFFIPIPPQTAHLPSVCAPSSVLSLERTDPRTRMLPHSRDRRGHTPGRRVSIVGSAADLERDPGENTATTGPRFDSRDLTTARRRSNVNVHRFEEIINGRSYRIEVSSVDAGQWRAQIVRVPGGSAALMPFYGKTPDEAAKHLSRWLSIVHGQSRGPARPGSTGTPAPGLKVDS